LGLVFSQVPLAGLGHVKGDPMLTAVPARRMALVWLVAAAFSISLAGLLASPVRAATFTVNSIVDAVDATPGDGICATAGAVCTLRAAIQEANALAGADVITVPAGTYTLSIAGAGEELAATGDLDVLANVTINGAGAGTTFVDGADLDRVFQVFVTAPSVAISGVTIQNGSVLGVGGSGGGLWADGTGLVTLTGVVVTANTATSSGGGVWTNSPMSFVNSEVSGNSANSGGGIWSNGTMSLTNSTVSSNTGGSGGGAGIHTNGNMSLTNSTVSGNSAPATTANVDGGGIWSNGNMSLTNSTVSGNVLPGLNPRGGGIWSNGTVNLLNSTISGNSAAATNGTGGGIWSNGIVTADFSTIVDNAATAGLGGGIDVGSTLRLFATIVANNAGGNCNGTPLSITSDGSNLSSDATCDLDQPSDKPNTDPMLGVLANNGGPTQTHALLAGSPAIDAVQLVGPQLCQATDQRSIPRPQDGDSNGTLVCDIGAYELLAISASISDVTVTEGNAGTVDAVFTVTLSRASTGTVTLAFATANGTATVVADYQAATGTLTFVPGDTSETITVRVVGDTIDEPNETFVVNLTAPVGATLADAQGTGTILDDEGPIVTPAPAPTLTPAAGQLPDTGVSEGRVGGWGAFGAAIGLVVVSAAALIRNRRRQVAQAR